LNNLYYIEDKIVFSSMVIAKF